jgi:adenine-specific DNA-methyltransferase
MEKDKKIDDDLYYFLLASLIESADKVANTASVYGAFLN